MFSAKIHLDPDNILCKDEKLAFSDFNIQFENVFIPYFGVHNNKSNHFRARLNIGPVEPPPMKGKFPLHGHNDFQLSQEMADQLEGHGVLGKPEDYGVTVKHGRKADWNHLLEHPKPFVCFSKFSGKGCEIRENTFRNGIQ